MAAQWQSWTSEQSYRLFTEQTFQTLRETRVPEVLRTGLSSVVLQLKALGIDDVAHFDFMSKPKTEAIIRALEKLVALGAIDRKGRLTANLGESMALLPLEPTYAKALLSSSTYNCSDEMLTIVSLLSADSGSIFVHSLNQRAQATLRRMEFMAPEGDLITYLNVYKAFKKAGESKAWCSKSFVNFRCLRHAVKVRQQLRRLLNRLKINVRSCGDDLTLVRKALLSGFFLNAARRQPNGEYRALTTGQEVRIHPSSVLSKKKPDCLIFNEIVLTSQKYIRDVTAIEPRWLAEVVPRYFGGSLSK